MKRTNRILVFSYGVIVYMLLAFIWWSILLHNKNQDAFKAKVELLRIGMIVERLYDSEETFILSKEYLELKKSYDRQEKMIIGETIVLTGILILGIIFINRAYKREVQAARQQQNFLLSITHELKSPLASIKLILETITKRSLDVNTTKDLSNKAIKESDRLNTLINDLLLAARLDSSYDLQKSNINLMDVIYNAVENFPTINNVPLIKIKTFDEFIDFKGDATALSRVFSNIIGNAIKYADAENDPVIDIDITNDSNHITIDIKDNGTGIPAQEKDKVFKKFYRIGNEDTRKTKGTGLGLYIVKSIIEGHNGKVKIIDNLPKGSIFHITLPFN